MLLHNSLSQIHIFSGNPQTQNIDSSHERANSSRLAISASAGAQAIIT